MSTGIEREYDLGGLLLLPSPACTTLVSEDSHQIRAKQLPMIRITDGLNTTIYGIDVR